MNTILIIIIFIIVFSLMQNKISNMTNIDNDYKKHKSDQYYTFNYLKDLKNKSDYIKEPSHSVYDEALKEHYKKIMVGRI